MLKTLIIKQETEMIVLSVTHSSLLFLTAWMFGSKVFFGKEETEFSCWDKDAAKT